MTVVSLPLPLRRRSSRAMGMPISLALRGRHSTGELADDAWATVLRVLTEVDAVFSTYRGDSAIRRLDRGEIALADCPPEVAEVLRLGEEARIASHGAFDVRRPDGAGGLCLDPSGVVKGWAVERAVAHIDLPDTDFCLSAGGDMACRTRLPATPDWRIGIEDPDDPSRITAVVPLRNGAVATSGLAHRGTHIIDARTGATPASANAMSSVTVVGDDLTQVDIEATAAFALGREGVAWLMERGRTGLVVWQDGRTETFG